ncbi:hypothetical protein WMY93_023131 [Mugilogobius chulae]|uniref:EF-hand domain-containing protein n=1 Tax=Mugilogobius chulae TaxID=88201 RepID=A0AAW0N8C9_9GOBI
MHTDSAHSRSVTTRAKDESTYRLLLPSFTLCVCASPCVTLSRCLRSSLRFDVTHTWARLASTRGRQPHNPLISEEVMNESAILPNSSRGSPLRVDPVSAPVLLVPGSPSAWLNSAALGRVVALTSCLCVCCLRTARSQLISTRTSISAICTGPDWTDATVKDMEISAEELKRILDNISRKNNLTIGDDGFSIETCRSMVAVMDSDSTGKLGFHEFKFLWNNIKKWQKIFVKYDRDKSGRISAQELPGALAEAGFRLTDPGRNKNDLYSLIVRRYADQNGEMDFDSYIGCLVRLDTMCRAFKTLDKDNNGTIDLCIEEFLQLTMYS